MKRKSASTLERKVLLAKSRIDEQVDRMTSRARTQVERKSNWVAGKVRQTMSRMERIAQ